MTCDNLCLRGIFRQPNILKPRGSQENLSCQMELGSPLLSVCFIMISLLGATRNSNGGKINCPCPDIPLRNLTEHPPKTCYSTNAAFRYKCLDGYVRKAGTSNLIKCEQINSAAPQWTEPSLRCIPDPKRTIIQLPRVTVTNFVRMTGAMDGTTSTSTTDEPSNNSTANPRVFELNSTTMPVIICASLAIICAFSAISFLFYKRRSTNRVALHRKEELMPMNRVQPAQEL